MKVLYVIDSLRRAGAEQSLVDLAPHLVGRGVELHVAYLRPRHDLADALISGGAHVHTSVAGPGRVRQLVRLVRLIRELRPHLVHTTLYEADVLGRVAAGVARCPVVTTWASNSYGQQRHADPHISPFKLRLARLVDSITCRIARRFHAVSAEVGETMSAALRVGTGRIDVMPRGRNLDRLGAVTADRRRTARALLGVDEATFLVVCIARHEHAKGVDVLVEAIEQVTPAGVALRIAGPAGALTPTITARLAGMGTNPDQVLLGSRADVAELMTAADLVVVPSRSEGMPGVVVEAMALRRPIVASDIRGVRDVLGTDAAGYAAAGSAASLAAAISQARQALSLDRTAFDATTSRAARRAADEFSIDLAARRMTAFYDRALNATR